MKSITQTMMELVLNGEPYSQYTEAVAAEKARIELLKKQEIQGKILRLLRKHIDEQLLTNKIESKIIHSIAGELTLCEEIFSDTADVTKELNLENIKMEQLVRKSYDHYTETIKVLQEQQMQYTVVEETLEWILEQTSI